MRAMAAMVCEQKDKLEAGAANGGSDDGGVSLLQLLDTFKQVLVCFNGFDNVFHLISIISFAPFSLVRL